MAKTEKKISISTLDKAMKEQAVGITTEQWFDTEIQIKHTLSIAEMLTFVKNVVEICFHETEGYLPELKDFAIRSNVLVSYANFTLPDNLEHRYELLYNTNAFETVLGHIDMTQFNNILESISEKIGYLCDSNIAAIEHQMKEVMAAFSDLVEKSENLFSGITQEDIGKITSAFADGQFSEEKLVKAYAAQLRGGDK